MTRPIPILLYHSVSHDISSRFKPWTVSPEHFAAHMNYLRVHRFTPITVTQLVRGMTNGDGDGFERPVVITFDDGLFDFYTGALPILNGYDFAATLYIPTGFVGKTSQWLGRSGAGNRPILTWSQIAEIAASGIECGGHSHTHPQLDTLALGAAWDEIIRCKIELEQHLGKGVTTFAYPHGYHSSAIRRLVQQAGYTSACGVKQAISSTADDRFALARIIVAPDTDLEGFDRLLAGVGLPKALMREKPQTTAWRMVRRSAALLRPPSRVTGVDEDSIQNVLIDADQHLLLHNLLNNFAELASLLRIALRRCSWLDAFLLATGMNQIIEDYLHRDPYLLGTTAKHLGQMEQPIGFIATRIVGLAEAAIVQLRTRRAQTQRLLRWQAEWAGFDQQLAAMAVCSTCVDPCAGEKLREVGEALLASLEWFPAPLLESVLRLPSCFRSFDQQPADLKRIAWDFAERWADRDKPLVVIGIRTSGSYLAPLYAAFLKANGYSQVSVLTLRPGRKVLKPERAILKAVVQAGGLVLVTDDPPITGASIAKAIQDLAQIGVPSPSIVLLLQLFSTRDALPPRLQGYASVLLPRSGWAIEKQLAPPAVQVALAGLLGPDIEVTCIERLSLTFSESLRGHACGVYHVRLRDRKSGRTRTQDIFVKGVGLGYLGLHSLAVVKPLRDFLPEFYGIKDGLSYRAWMPEELRLSRAKSDRAHDGATAAVAYIRARHQALAVKEDVSRRLFGQRPVWEVASNLLSQAFAKGWLLARPTVIDPAVQHLLRVKQPSVVDGSTSLSHWFASKDGVNPLLKVDFDEHAFSHLDLCCYDPIFDLAGLASSCQDNTFLAELRCAYERVFADSISDERWLLYQLVHLWNYQRNHAGTQSEIRRRCSRALQDYFSRLYFNELVPPNSGPLCAIDIDGVLETSPLGFPGLTPSGAVALRALLLHGYRPILATGRSLPELRERCSAYRLPGGVAEYGGVIYNRDTDCVYRLLSEADYADLNRLRSALIDIKGIYLDSDFRSVVRAYRLDSRGRRVKLSPDTIISVLSKSRLWDKVTPISGQAQTDFTIARIDKGVGLRILANKLSDGNPGIDHFPLAFAVGDSIADLPMFDLAAMAFAPANADDSVRQSGVTVLDRPYQAGLVQAVSKLLGHLPGACPLCREPGLSHDAKLLHLILAAQETGIRGMLRNAFLLGFRLRQG